MKFVEHVNNFQFQGDRLLALLDGVHPLRVEAVTPTIVRVLVQKTGALRLDRTWSIAQGEATVPWEGLSRESLLETPAPASWDGQTFSTGEIDLQFHNAPYHLQWSYRGRPILTERRTGALAFGRRGHRLWHFHTLRPESRFYGLGERTGELNRRGRRFEMRNVDPMGYDARNTDPLYKHFPFLIECNDNGAFALFYDNYANAAFDLGQEIDNYHGPFTSYRADDGDFDMYLMAGPSLLEVTRQFSWLTGRTYLPPKWSLGYSATSMHYTDDDQASAKLERFLEQTAEHEIPLKTFKYGSGYTSRDGKRYVFTWNRDKFPDPKATAQQFRQRGIRLNANVKPVLLTDHPLYEEATPLFVRDSQEDCQEVSQFWDNRGSHLDFSNPDTIAWWQKMAREQVLEMGFDALWNDNNEYVVWDDEARCHGFGRPFPISVVRPLMSQWMTRASHEVTQAQDPNRRVWSISRCGCPGMQRYAQTWSGDNATAWETLEYNTKMALGLSMSGVYNIGHDTGGFTGPAPDAELLTRWFFIGAFTPRFGVNSWKPGCAITEPWMYPEALPAIKKALALRMRLLPHLYSLMVDAHRAFLPVLRPTMMNFPQDARCLIHDTEMMWGDSVLIAPVLRQGQLQRRVYLPLAPQGWWSFPQGIFYEAGQEIEVEAPLDSVPMFVRGGSALFLAQQGADSIDGPESARELHLFPGADFEAVFHDDDGETHSPHAITFGLTVRQFDRHLQVDLASQGDYRPPYGALKFVVPAGWTVDPPEQPL